MGWDPEGWGRQFVMLDFPPPHTQTPGPCNYRVVDTGVYKNRPPHYSIIARNMLPGDTTIIPGPGAYSPEKVRACKGRDFCGGPMQPRGHRMQGEGAATGVSPSSQPFASLPSVLQLRP